MPSDKRRIILPISRENPRYHQNHPLLPPLLHFFLPPPTSSLQPHLHSSSLLPLSLSPSVEIDGPRLEQITHSEFPNQYSELLVSSRSEAEESSKAKGRGWREGAREKSRFLFPSSGRCWARRPIEERSEGGRRRGAVVGDHHRGRRGLLVGFLVVGVADAERRGSELG